MRLFWALVPPAELIAAVEQAVRPMRERWPGLRWTAPGGWHVTLAFLGSVSEDRVDPLVTAVAEAVRTAAPVSPALRDHADTPGRGRGIVWVPLAPDPAIGRLAAAVRSACGSVVELDDPRPWRGHLTLARVPRRVREPGPLAIDVAAAYRGPGRRWTADRVTLLHSATGPDGPRYRTVAAVSLTG